MRGGSILLRRKRAPPRANEESGLAQARREESRLEMLRNRRQRTEAAILGRLSGTREQKIAAQKTMHHFLEEQREEKHNQEVKEAQRERQMVQQSWQCENELAAKQEQIRAKRKHTQQELFNENR